jgi:antirestriction protein ArdC
VTKARAPKASKADAIYEKVTNALIEAIESADTNAGAWKLPWHFTGQASTFSPVNALTKVPYKGGNVIAFWIDAETKGFTSGHWATFKQWQQLVGKDAEGESIQVIRKGEKASYGIKWANVASKDPEKVDKDGKPRRFLIPFGFAVFNAEQLADEAKAAWDAKEAARQVEPGPDPVEHADAFFAAIGATVSDAPSAFYAPGGDYIGIPPLRDFVDSEAYYGTLGHEHVHWTGAKSRLDRGLFGTGIEDYAFEELVAEFGAAFLCAQLGISNEPRPDHAQYLKGWLRRLKDDPKAAFKAAGLAAKAVSFLTEQAGEVEVTYEDAQAEAEAGKELVAA